MNKMLFVPWNICANCESQTDKQLTFKLHKAPECLSISFKPELLQPALGDETYELNHMKWGKFC